ncbi:unnamed protein product [Arctogadus glacialis]
MNCCFMSASPVDGVVLWLTGWTLSGTPTPGHVVELAGSSAASPVAELNDYLHGLCAGDGYLTMGPVVELVPSWALCRRRFLRHGPCGGDSWFPHGLCAGDGYLTMGPVVELAGSLMGSVLEMVT